MKNITLSADANLIEQARPVAMSEHKSLNTAFREWLESYARRKGDVQAHRLMRRLSHIDSGRPYTRDEMNERWILPRYQYPGIRLEQDLSDLRVVNPFL